MSVSAEGVTWKIGKRAIVDDVSIDVRPGETLGLLGPNGSGKTSLLRLLAGLRQPHAGRITIGGMDLRTTERRIIAKRVAFVEQHAATNASLKVIDVVKLGRFPHRSLFSGWSIDDQNAVEAALEKTGIAGMRDALWQTLSGGEKQRVHIARALAQTPMELFLDEPTNHLDVHHQISLLRLVSKLPVTSIIALHDLNHAAMFCDRLIVMKAGRIATAGSPEEVLTEKLLREVFSVEARIEPSRHHARLHVHYLL